MIVPHEQDAVSECTLVAAINPRTGRQVVNLRPECILPPLIALRCVGERWIDGEGHEWEKAGLYDDWRWQHSPGCVCFGTRPMAGA